MIWYALVAGILIYFFELVGRYVLSILKIDNFICCFGIGLIVFLAYSYVTTSLMTALNGSFYVICTIYSLFFIILIILIIKDRKKISFKIDLINTLVLIVFVFIMILYAYNTTLGELSGFDSTFYLNLVTSNIKSNHMNYSYFSNGAQQAYISRQYTFQTYYYVASFFSYVFSNIINIFHRTYYQTVYVWVFQILFNAFFYSLIVNSIYLMKNKSNKIITILILLFFLFVYGRIYYYNVYGFYGNTYRVVTTGYATLLLYLLTTNNRNNELMTLFIISLLGAASVSSSSVFIDIFILYGSYFVLCNKYKDVLKFYSVPLLFVLTNLFSITIHLSILNCLLISFVISIILYLFGEKINSLLSKKKSLIAILSLSIAFMFIASLLKTKNLFDFYAFFDNLSERGDMNINYFNLGSSRGYLYLKLFILGLLILSLFSIKKVQFVQFTLILFLCLFNPFCCSFLYKVLIVYFRAFDIIVNPFTIILYINLLSGYFKDKIILKVVLCACIAFIIIDMNPLYPLYYHTSFAPEHDADAVNYSNYNNEFKMSQDEKETIDVICDDIDYFDLSNPYIITPSLLMKGLVPNGRYLFNRERDIDQYNSNSERQLFAIFYPERYLGDRVKGIEPEYDNIEKFINESKIDYLVVDKKREYYDTNQNNYTYLYWKVLESYYPMFENDRYMVFRCFYQ